MRQGPRAVRRNALFCAVLAGAVLAGSACAETPAPQPSPPEALPTDVPSVAGAPALGARPYPVPSGAKVVAPNGNDAADGSLQTPWRTLTHAVASSPAGATIVLRAGTYRESVQVYGKAVTIQPYPGERVVLSGSDVVTGWSPDGDDFVRRGWTPSFPRLDDAASGQVNPEAPLAGWPEMAFIDGAPQRQVASRAAVQPGTFFVDDAADAVYLGTNPAGKTVELSVRRWGLYFNGAHRSVVRGIGVRHFATPISDVAAIRAYSDGVRLEDLVVEDNAYIGVSAMGQDIQVRTSTFNRNGQLGVHGFQSDGLVVDSSSINGNNAERFEMADQAGGLKVVQSRRLRFNGNVVRDNAGHGLWVDQSSYDVVMTRNLVQRSAAAGLHLEVSANAVLAGNAVTNNAAMGILVVESTDVQVWNNTVLDNVRDLDIIENTRTSLNLLAPEHDRRWPLPNPLIPFDVRRVTVFNNVLGGGAVRNIPLFRVDDVAHLRSFRDMGVTSDNNAYYRRNPADGAWVSLFNLGTTVLVAETLDEHQQVTGQDRSSGSRDGAVNPWVADASANDFRVPPSAPNRIGAALPARVAEVLGRPAGERPPIGTLGTPR